MNIDTIKNNIIGMGKFEDNQIYCVWSGGCDSTAVILGLLEHTDKIIHTVAFDHVQIGHVKMKMERQKRNEFLCWCQSQEKYKNRIKHEDINLNAVSVEIAHESGSTCPQPFMWLSNILAIVPNESVIAFGYHKGDDFFTYDIFSNWLTACSGITNLLGKNLYFHFPYQDVGKDGIISDLKRYGAYDYTWYCECPNALTKTPCGHCLPCKTHKAALFIYEEEQCRIEKQETFVPQVEELKKVVDDVENVKADIPLTRGFGQF